ncbi:MAG: hypothetical protein IIY71_01800 [Oscillospiraceae bacterium]|nr:hypothetical protein [Oscillospiraceae bacterium]
MKKTLLKKQLLEFISSLSQRRNRQKRKTGSSILLYALLFLFVMFSFGILFFQMAQALCAPLVQTGFDWMYFALMGLIATALGIIGSVFHTYSALYHAKDNELLLSMPISPPNILFSRMAICYLTSFLFEAIVLVPTILVYHSTGANTILSLLFQVLILFLLPLFALAASCFLGWLVALFASHIRGNKSIFTVVLALVFLAGYYYLYARASHYLQLILVHQSAIGKTIQTALFPAYQMGLAAKGQILPFLLFAGMVLAIFAIVYWILSRSFLSLVTKKRGESSIRSRQSKLVYRSTSQRKALFHKELHYFKNNATYMLNCGLGVVFILLLAGFLFFKARWLRTFLPQISAYVPNLSQWIPLMVCGVIGLMVATIDITAPSVSLEGKRLWVVQSAPLSAWDILWAKEKLHLLIGLPPTLLCAVAVNVVLLPDILTAFLILSWNALFVFFCASLGLAINLKRPNLNWINETTPVKQSASVILSLLGGWATLLVLGGLCFLLHNLFSPLLLLLLCTILLGFGFVFLLWWLKKKGTACFDALSS